MPISFKKISHATLLLLVFTIVKSALSILVRSSTAKFFGASDVSDAYFAAFTVPQQISDFFLGGVLFLVIIPVFLKRKTETDEATAARDVAGFLNITALLLLVATVVYFMLAPWITAFIFPGFKGAKLELTIRLSRLYAPAILLMGLSIVYISFYHAYREFFIPSLASLLFPLSSLIALWCLPDSWGIDRLLFGNLAGCGAGLAIMAFLISKRIQWQWSWDIANPVVRSTFILSLPVLLDCIVSKAVFFVQKSAASRLDDGTVTMLDNALFLSNAALLLMTGPISTAVFPLMGEQKSQDGDGMVFLTFLRTVRTMFFLAIPATVFIIVMAPEIVRLFLGYGKYSVEDSATTATLLVIMSTLIIPNCFSGIGGRLFFIFQETSLISYTGVTLSLLSCPFYFLLSSVMGIQGIALAYALTYWAVGFLVFALLKTRHRSLDFTELYASLYRFAVPGGLMAAACMGGARLTTCVDSPLVRLLVVSIFGGGTYIAVAYAMKIEELRFIAQRIPFLKSVFAEQTISK